MVLFHSFLWLGSQHKIFITHEEGVWRRCLGLLASVLAGTMTQIKFTHHLAMAALELNSLRPLLQGLPLKTYGRVRETEYLLPTSM